MGAKIEFKEKRFMAGPASYNTPSKVVESQGQSFGLKLKSQQTTDKNGPGPGEYVNDKSKS
jgi:hypothetical protein